MEIKDILSRDCTRCAVPLTSKKRVLQYISSIAAEKVLTLNEDEILSSLLCREKLGSTCIGGGIAIPHGRVSGIEVPVAVAVTSQSGVNFGSIENQQVDIFFAVMVPATQEEEHLKTLGCIARKLGDTNIVKQIRKSNSDQQLYDILQ